MQSSINKLRVPQVSPPLRDLGIGISVHGPNSDEPGFPRLANPDVRQPPEKQATKASLAPADRTNMDLSAIALQGLQQADLQLEQAASRIASNGAASPAGAGLDVADLSTEMVALISAQDQFSVNVSTLKTAGELQKNLIDLMA